MNLPYGPPLFPRGSDTDVRLRSSIDKDVVSDIQFFFEKINERNLFTRGLVPKYEAPSVALGEDVEYFSPQITLDDRMVYIMRHIVTSKTLSEANKICNTVISHFYGARGIHTVLTGIEDPDQAHVDFDLIAEEQKTGKLDYTLKLREITRESKKKGLPFWGTTELHTSIQNSGNKFVVKHHGAEALSSLAVAEWIASWITDGTVKAILDAPELGHAYKALVKQPGVGPYYGYHCSTSNSVNPSLKFHHDDPFCMPGPGARLTLDKIFPGLDEKTVGYGDRVVWIRENQDELFPGLRDVFHPETHNVTVNGKPIFEHNQGELKVYGTEVGLCQYGVYCRLRENPELAKKRKVSRVENTQSKLLAPEKCAIEEFFH